jgi:RloB-like protein
MNYNKPSKTKANEDFLRSIGFKKEINPYKEERLEVKKSFLIICEGENTEPLYFKNFPVPSNTVMIEGGCYTKTKLVDYALEISKKEKYIGREIWCVFDYDLKPDEAETQPQDFNNAITKAESYGLKVAWSNDAFELWFVLHYQRLDVGHTRKELFPILKKEWKLESFRKIAKTRKFSEGHYDRHIIEGGRLQKLAITRAKELHEKYIGREDFANLCPCTTVYLLVEELNKNLKK